MEKGGGKLSILMFPWLAHGHIFPFLELAKNLSKRNFNIHFCSTAVNLDSIRKSIEKLDLSIKLVQLNLPESPDLPPELHTTKNLSPNLMPLLVQAMQNSISNFSDIINSLKPDLLIYDFYQPWAPKLALSQGIPSVYFATSGATPVSFAHHLYTYKKISTFPHLTIDLKNQEKVDSREIVKIMKNAGKDFAFGSFKMSSDIILVNSCRGVEGKYIDYLSTLCKKQIVPTGPLVNYNVNDTEEEKDIHSSDIMRWLSEKDEHSTVYISFGSEYFLSETQIEQVARGLELCSATNFIWVIRFPHGEKRKCIEELLPFGFLQRVKERGIIVQKWAPQAKILSHPSIGGFLSHCGWSSITECMYFGVPVIGLPMKYDQPINSSLAVETGFGVEVERGQNGHFVGEEIAKAINKVFKDKCFGESLRSKARELSEKIKKDEDQEATEAAEQISKLCIKNKY
ncbi:hypothetical protein RD792_004960 [Penstemon davidsonii]|uniref:Glycosyltransferase N-terminal domain-containing protein n=1 Tax=Penstemon davidsonii TaxID=160366 RepID=A0ABR0DIW5_9LAMI|nr:hypothetical protein RD792_004960 [Penstemon davidsonii]